MLKVPIDPDAVAADGAEARGADGYFLDAPPGTRLVVEPRSLYFLDTRTVLMKLKLTRPGQQPSPYVVKVRYGWMHDWKVVAITENVG